VKASATYFTKPLFKFEVKIQSKSGFTVAILSNNITHQNQTPAQELRSTVLWDPFVNTVGQVKFTSIITPAWVKFQAQRRSRRVSTYRRDLFHVSAVMLRSSVNSLWQDCHWRVVFKSSSVETHGVVPFRLPRWAASEWGPPLVDS